MTRAELKARAKEQLKGNVWRLFLCMALIYVITYVVGLVAGLVSEYLILVAYVITPPLSLGLIMVYLQVSYGNKAEVAKLFEGFQHFGKSIALYLLLFIFIFLWCLLLIIPGYVKAISYSMSYYVMAENPNMTAREAINESKAIMNGHKAEYFVLQLSFIPWILLTAVTFGIASIYVIPYMQLTTTNFYHSIKRQPTEDVQTETIGVEPAAEDMI